jgi:hypothetical protein
MVGVLASGVIYSVKSSWELVFIVIQKPNSNKVFLSYSYLIVCSNLVWSNQRLWNWHFLLQKGMDTLYVIQSVRHGFQFSIYIRLQKLFKSTFVSLFLIHVLHVYSNTTSFFRFVNKRASYPFGIISLAHAPVNATDFFIGRINCVRHFPQT